MILALDIGTTMLKGALFDTDGTPREMGQRHLPLSSSRTHSLYHETDALEWIRGIRDLCMQLGISREKRLEAIVVSGNGPTLVPVGQDDKPLHPAILWMDRRCVEESATISKINGFYVDPTFYLPKALWFYNHKPEVYEKTKYFFSCSEYVNYLLTGNASTVLPMEKLRSYIWTEDLVTKLGMDWSKFPGFVRPGDAIGRTTNAAQGLLGVPSGIPVFAGGPDFIVAIIGTATVAPGRVCDRAGTSEGINLCTDQTVSDSRLLCMDHVIEGYNSVSGVVSTSGKALQWFKEISGNGELSFETLFNQIAKVPAGANGLLFLPYLAGERAPIWDPNARGAFIGLTMNHGRREMTRAVVESVGFAIRDIIEVMEENRLVVNDVRITGGQARSAQWVQIKADITGKRFVLPVMKDAEMAGNLSIARFGLKHYKTLAQAAEASVQIERTFEPNKENKRVYDTLFEAYRESYVGLKNVFGKISGIPQGGSS